METPEGWGICVKEAEELEVGIGYPPPKHGNPGVVGSMMSQVFIANSNSIEIGL